MAPGGVLAVSTKFELWNTERYNEAQVLGLVLFFAPVRLA
jgi:hypothetical protein